MNRFKARKNCLLFILILSVFSMIGCGGGEWTGHWTPGQGVTLTSINVTPAAATIPITGFQQFTATATYSDGSTRDVTTSSSWTSGTPGVATVSPTTGVAVGVTTGGPVLITAAFGGMTATANLTVSTATSVSFFVTPGTASIPVSGTQQFAAIEIFSDGSSFDRTTVSAWTAPDLAGGPGVATIGAATGLATGAVAGQATVTAAYGVYTGAAAATAILTVTAATSTKFEVTPKTASTPVTGTQQYTAIETFSDGTTIDRTTVSAWTSSNGAVATVGAATGLATGVAIGTSNIIAAYGGYTALVGLADRTAVLTVTAATSKKFEVMPKTATISVSGAKQQFAAIETFSDGTTIDRTTVSAWTSGTPAVATVGAATGLASGVAIGTSNIIAAYGGYTGGVGLADRTAVLTVTAPNPGSAGSAPDLKTVAPYGIMAWDAITINAGSHIYGDVALPGGVMASVTGPGTKDGGAAPHLTASAVTNSAGVTPGEINTTDNGTLTLAQLGQLQLDLKSVYDDLMARAAPATPLTTIASAAGQNGGTFAAATDLSGYVLSPGIFTTALTYGLSNTSGPLVLDAGGNPDAVFIIRSTGLGISGLTSTTGSVLLQNGAQSKNIFWVMDNLTVGGSTFFQGTVVTGHVITLNTFANVQGRMLAGALSAASGAITLSGTNVITVPAP